MKKLLLILSLFATLTSCRKDGGETIREEEDMSLSELAGLLSSLPIAKPQMGEVHDAVSASLSDGYDEEYTLRKLFDEPGAGVGSAYSTTKAAPGRHYATPMRELIRAGVSARLTTKSGEADAAAVERYLSDLRDSDMQIYWPYSENWDGSNEPIVTFDPGGDRLTNLGYKLSTDDSGRRRVEEVVVTEDLARNHPVWIINRNRDAAYKSMEILRREQPEALSGGLIIPGKISTKSICDPSKGNTKTLFLKDMLLRNNLDTWFCGANECVLKIGGIEDFTASTEAEMRLFNPMITDIMMTVPRNMVGHKIPLNCVLLSNWSEQLQSVALMISEDDGGFQSEWKCEGTVKINSKSFGFTINIPVRTRDDIVWRGTLSSAYLNKYNGKTSRFGDVDLTLCFE